MRASGRPRQRGRYTRERSAEDLGPVREDCASRARRSRRGGSEEPGLGAQPGPSVPARRPGLRAGPRGHVVQRALQPGECGPGAAPGHRCSAARSGPPRRSWTPLTAPLRSRSPAPLTWMAEKVWVFWERAAPTGRPAESSPPPDSSAARSQASPFPPCPLLSSPGLAESLEAEGRLSPLGARGWDTSLHRGPGSRLSAVWRAPPSFAFLLARGNQRDPKLGSGEGQGALGGRGTEPEGGVREVGKETSSFLRIPRKYVL